MEIRISTQQLLKILFYVALLLFVGICIESGMYIFNGFYTYTINSYNANFLSLKALYQFDPGHYGVVMLLLSIVTTLKAVLFFVIVKLLHDKNLNLYQPFSTKMYHFLLTLSGLSVVIAFFSNYGLNYLKWLQEKPIALPDLSTFAVGGGDVWFFMGIILFLIAKIFKRGIEIQSDNELTI